MTDRPASTPSVSSLARRLPARLREDPIVVVLALSVVAIFLGFTAARPAFASWQNLTAIGQQSAVIAIVAVAMTLVILGRGLDLSPGSTVALTGVAGALLLEQGVSGPVSAVLVVAVGAAVGVVNGLLIGVLGVSPFMATLATLAAARGAALMLSGGSGIYVEDPVVLWFGKGEVAGIPVSVLIALSCLGAGWWLLSRSVFGRWVRATGGNPEAARASLVPVLSVTVLLYVLTGAAAGLGALVTLGRLGSAQPLAGSGLEFSAITAVVIGGTKLSGGEGGLGGTMLGALLVGVITSGMSFFAAPQETTYFVTAGLIVVALLLQRPDLFGSLWSLRRRWVRPPGTGPTDETDAADVVALERITKAFPGVVALRDVSFTIPRGEVVALMGENGAGKSTLVKILAGVQQPDSGRVVIDGRAVRISGPHHAAGLGVSVIHQHLSLAPELSVAENVFLGGELRVPGTSLLRRREMHKRTRDLLAHLQVDLSPEAPVASLGVGQRQMIELAKALRADARLVVMDEPTSALSRRERDHLYATVQLLSEQGIGVLYISHRMEEVYVLARRAVVLRDGQLVAELALAETSEAELIAAMVGRDIDNVFPHTEIDAGKVALVVRELGDGRILHEASLEVYRGEVVVLVGLMGSGRTELLRCLSGMAKPTTGVIEVHGQRAPTLSPMRATELGIGFVPEDRHHSGVISQMTAGSNLSLSWLRRGARRGIIPRRAERNLVSALIRQLNVRPPDPAKRVSLLSGGNQQKLVIGKALATQPSILLLDEPTRGVDVGAKAEIHAQISELKEAGTAILMASSELPEALGVADRIVVLHEGRTVATLPRGTAETDVMAHAFGRAAVHEPGEPAARATGAHP